MIEKSSPDSPQPPPRLPSIPRGKDHGRELVTTKPPDESLQGQMRELATALKNVSELALRLETSLLQARIAIVTDEHKINRVTERQDEQARDFGKLAERVLALENAQAAE